MHGLAACAGSSLIRPGGGWMIASGQICNGCAQRRCVGHGRT